MEVYTVLAELSLKSGQTKTECPEARSGILAVDRTAWCGIRRHATIWSVLLESWCMHRIILSIISGTIYWSPRLV